MMSLSLAAGVGDTTGHKNMLYLIRLRWIAVLGQITTIAGVSLGLASPEPELAASSRNDFVGREHQSNEPTGRSCRDSRLQPTVELPAHTIGDRTDRQRSFVAPQPGEAFTVLALDFARQPRTGQAQRVESRVQLFGQRTGGERDLFDALDRWFELE